MNHDYKKKAQIFKALADETRLQIIDMLLTGELCACKILDNFDITQPTLSYHMGILTGCGLVTSRRDGSWIRYTLHKETFADVCFLLDDICKSIRAEIHDDCCKNA